MQYRPAKTLIAVLALLTFVCSKSYAQTAKLLAPVTIKVTDQTNAVIPKAHLLIIPLKTSSDMFTGPDGVLTLQLAPGKYELYVNAPSYKTYKSKFEVVDGVKQIVTAQLTIKTGGGPEVVPASSPATTESLDLPASPNLRTVRMPEHDKALLTSALRAVLKKSEYPFETESKLNRSLQSIRIKILDLNNDGVNEVLAQGSEPTLCGHSGICSFWVFRHERDGYDVLLTASATLFEITRFGPNTYADIETSYQYSANEIEFELYRFNQSQYFKVSCRRNVSSDGCVKCKPVVEDCE